MGAGQAFLLVETTATIFMAGVLWTMQLLNYPLLPLVGAEAFPGYEAASQLRQNHDQGHRASPAMRCKLARKASG